jgi:hypothetical protein
MINRSASGRRIKAGPRDAGMAHGASVTHYRIQLRSGVVTAMPIFERATV